MADSYFLVVKGSKQGTFKGEGSGKGKDKGIPIFGYNLDAKVQHSAGSGQATGKRTYEPLSITKEVGAASTQFFQALVSGEILDDVVVINYKTGKNGKETAYFRITLEDALISEIEHEPIVSFSDDVLGTGEVETVSFVFPKITLENLAAGTVVVDDIQGKA